MYLIKNLVNIFLYASLCLNTFVYAMAPKRDWNQAIDHAVMRYGLRTEPELKQYFRTANLSYPPKDIAFLAFKTEQKMELWAKNDSKTWTYVHTYPLTANSGQLGPKLKENDKQIPEGIYELTMFNPYSSMHLSMQINYPNQFDKIQAFKEGRTQLGGNIFLHGKNLSVGCLAIGDHAIDQLFLLVRRVGLRHTKIIIAPNDLRVAKVKTNVFMQPKWVSHLYQQINDELHAFPKQHLAKAKINH